MGVETEYLRKGGSEDDRPGDIRGEGTDREVSSGSGEGGIYQVDHSAKFLLFVLPVCTMTAPTYSSIVVP